MSASWTDEPDPLISSKESQEEYCLISPEGFELLAPSMPAGDSRLVVPQICRRTLASQFVPETQQGLKTALQDQKAYLINPLKLVLKC